MSHTTVSGGWMRKTTGQQPVSYWVRVLHEQVERERQEREARESELDAEDTS
ncbi:MAG TPA: hypothetical protein VJ547_10560 [Candidatus Thermoplasmatota archaeon]|nr:hypothetical protein [Candidatus Thermoplasmatota archaeon]